MPPQKNYNTIGKSTKRPTGWYDIHTRKWLNRLGVHFGKDDWGGTEHRAPQSAVLQLKWGEKVCSLLPIYLGAVTWSGSRFKTKSRKNFFTQHIIVQPNSLTQGNVQCRNSNHFKKGIRSVLKTPPKAIKCNDLSAAACWRTVLNHRQNEAGKVHQVTPHRCFASLLCLSCWWLAKACTRH